MSLVRSSLAPVRLSSLSLLSRLVARRVAGLNRNQDQQNLQNTAYSFTSYEASWLSSQEGMENEVLHAYGYYDHAELGSK